VILADTSVWIDHLRQGNAELAGLLEASEIVCHPFVTGEIALGHLKRRAEILSLLAALPQARLATHDEVLGFIEEHGLVASGLGWVDAHLLCAALDGSRLWTFDRRLAGVAARLGLGT
jgi:predicted nucleic acid-binding protein